MTTDPRPVSYDATALTLNYDSGSGLINIPLSGGGGGSTNVTVCTNLSALRGIALSITDIGIIQGYHSAWDINNAITYIWNSADTRTDDGGSIIQVTGVSTGRYNLVHGGDVPISCFGAVADALTDAQGSVQSGINANLGRLAVPPGIFSISSGAITLSRAASVIGIGAAAGSFPANSGAETKSVIHHNYSGDLFTITGVSGDVNASCGFGLENLILRQAAGTATSAQGTAIHAVWTSDLFTPSWLRLRDINIEVVPGADQWAHGIVFDGGTSAGQNLRDIWVENSRIYVDTHGTDAVKIVNCANVFLKNCLVNGAAGIVNVTGSSGHLSTEVTLDGCNINILAIDYAQQVRVIGGAYGTITFTSNTGPCEIDVDYLTNLPSLPLPAGVNVSAKYCAATGGPINYGSSFSGTWTPACSAGTPTWLFANWTKADGIVQVNFDITFPTSSSTSDALITGLPFASTSDYFNGVIGYSTYTGIYNIQGGFNAGSTTGFKFRTGISSAYATFANLSGKRVIGSFSYPV